MDDAGLRLFRQAVHHFESAAGFHKSILELTESVRQGHVYSKIQEDLKYLSNILRDNQEYFPNMNKREQDNLRRLQDIVVDFLESTNERLSLIDTFNRALGKQKIE